MIVKFLTASHSETSDPAKAALIGFYTDAGESYVVPMPGQKRAGQGSESSAPRYVMKASVSGAFSLDVLGLPYYGPFDMRDYHGQYFSPETDFHEPLIPSPPVVYFHGAATSAKALDGEADLHLKPVGEVKRRWRDESGGWFSVDLNPAHPITPRLMSAARKGNLYASTGVVPALHRVDDDGHIRDWLVGELSLMDLDIDGGRVPANFYAMAFPRVKALLDGKGDAAEPFLKSRFYNDADGRPCTAQEAETDPACNDVGGDDVSGMLDALLRNDIPDFLQLDPDVFLSPGINSDSEGATMDEKMKAKFHAWFVKMFGEGNPQPGNGGESDTNLGNPQGGTHNKPHAGANPDFEGSVKCGACGSAKCMPTKAKDDDGNHTDTDEADDAMKAIMAELQNTRTEMARMKQAATAAEDDDYLKGLVKARKIAPAELPQLKTLMDSARAADARHPETSQMLAQFKAALEARIPQTAFNPSDFGKGEAGLKMAGFDAANGDDKVDADYMRRARERHGIAAKATADH